MFYFIIETWTGKLEEEKEKKLFVMLRKLFGKVKYFHNVSHFFFFLKKKLNKS